MGENVVKEGDELEALGFAFDTQGNRAQHCRKFVKTFCKKYSIDYHECGKLIVAVVENEIPELDRLLSLGLDNGVENLRLVSGRELKDLAPEVRAVQGLYSPRTAIINAEETAKAVSIFNRLSSEGKDVAGAFHLTC